MDPTALTPDELVDELQKFVKLLLGYGANLPKELMLFVKNLMFVDAAIGTLAPDLDLFGEVTHIATYFAQNHGQRLASEMGQAGQNIEVDLTSFKDSVGIDRSTESITYNDLKERRDLIHQRMHNRRDEAAASKGNLWRFRRRLRR